MGKIARLCHGAGARAYLALNTIAYESELGKIRALLARARTAGIDAVICWDFAVIEAARSLGLPVFASTQMSVSNSSGLLALYRRFGIKRFVLARECSLDDMKKIRKSLVTALGSKAHGDRHRGVCARRHVRVGERPLLPVAVRARQISQSRGVSSDLQAGVCRA